jgi:hypothetical protein
MSSDLIRGSNRISDKKHDQQSASGKVGTGFPTRSTPTKLPSSRHRQHANGFLVARQGVRGECSGKMRQRALALVAARYRLLLLGVTG